jgi:hypothetical protein
MPDSLPEAVQTVNKARRLAKAYETVFGPEGKRGVDQDLVWADIESFCYAHRLCLEGKPDGDLSNNYLMNEGRRSFYIRARGMLVRAILPVPSPLRISRKAKPNP